MRARSGIGPVLVALLLVVLLPGLAAAAVVFQDLGTAAPPTSVGIHTLTPFNQVPQAAIPDLTVVSAIPGDPVPPGSVGVAPGVQKLTTPGTWNGWGTHGYAGAVYLDSSLAATLTLPPVTGAFYLYLLPNSFGTFTITATANDGTSSGPIPVVSNPSGVANGYLFYIPDASSQLTSIVIAVQSGTAGFGMGEFGAAARDVPIPTLSEWAMILMAALLVGFGLWSVRGRIGFGGRAA